jgi:RHS repeat-associated protein
MVAYTKLGLDQTVIVAYPQPDVEMTYVKLSGEPNGDGGDIYTGLDRFNRVIDVRWINSSNADINRFKYGFSRASNRLWRQNVVASSGGFDEQYLYDNLYQVTGRLQGTLSGGVITGTPVEEEDFNFDPTGNWPGYVIQENGTMTLNQTRDHQTANEITAISGGVTPGYDPNGNMTTMPQVDNWSTAQTVTYDAWNRPITVKQSTTTLGTYQYDGLNRRIWKQSLESGTLTTRHFYYSNQWQVLEERTGTSTSADKQYVWGTRYEDDLVLRDAFSGTSGRMYALADYFQPTAIADTTGTVQERYVYRAFGDVSFYNGSFSPISSSAYDWTYLYASYPLDLETNLYQVRYRYYHSALGRWLSRDPLTDAELLQGANLYWYVGNNAVNAIDALGLATEMGPLTADGSNVGSTEHNSYVTFHTTCPKGCRVENVRLDYGDMCGCMYKAFVAKYHPGAPVNLHASRHVNTIPATTEAEYCKTLMKFIGGVWGNVRMPTADKPANCDGSKQEIQAYMRSRLMNSIEAGVRMVIDPTPPLPSGSDAVQCYMQETKAYYQCVKCSS